MVIKLSEKTILIRLMQDVVLVGNMDPLFIADNEWHVTCACRACTVWRYYVTDFYDTVSSYLMVRDNNFQ